MKKDYIKISKFLSFILRHHPEIYGIKLNSDGFADLEQIIDILNQKFKFNDFKGITKKILKNIIKKSDKCRYEISNNKIRAYYGHSIKEKIIMDELKKIPKKLFHGTTLKAYRCIKKEGLKNKSRQYVHLTNNIKNAEIVAKRRTNNPIILEINTDNAKKDGVKFYKSGDMFLADFIPPEHISKLK
ncbi:MAG: RNA 2'-phosphotransferase [Promethearchaeota archaeon]